MEDELKVEVMGEAVVDAVPLRVMMAGSGPVSDPAMAEVEGNIVEEEYTKNMGSDFQVPVCLKKIDLKVMINKFNLPAEFEYKLPRERDMTYTPLLGYITVYLHMLKVGFRILPLSFQLVFLKECDAIHCLLLLNA